VCVLSGRVCLNERNGVEWCNEGHVKELKFGALVNVVLHRGRQPR
jgi:hypothetical protein